MDMTNLAARIICRIFVSFPILIYVPLTLMGDTVVPVKEGSSPGNEVMSLNICSRHFAPPGYDRMAGTRYGQFWGYSFGSTNLCDGTVREILSESRRFLCATNILQGFQRPFDKVVLYHSFETRRLVCISGSVRIFGKNAEISAVQMFNRFVNECMIRYAIRLQKLGAENVTKNELEKDVRIWKTQSEDSVFKITLCLSLISKNEFECTLSVENKELSQVLPSKANIKTEIEVRDLGL